MVIKNVRKKDLRNLDKSHYKIVAAHQDKDITVSRPIPYDTGYNCMNIFPSYLKGFEEYYDKTMRNYYHGTYTSWHLKKEYYYNKRPLYNITISNIVYDIELTDTGESIVRARFAQHMKLMNEYNHLLGN